MNETPMAMMGATQHRSRRGAAVWLLGAEPLFSGTTAIRFARRSKSWADAWLRHYGFLYCWPHKENTVHLRWLSWLGFKSDPTDEPLEIPFAYLYLDSSCVPPR